MNYSIPEPAPIPNDNPSIHDLVIEDLKDTIFDGLIKHIEDRKQLGLEKYGIPLQCGNGRNALIDAFQELGDAIAYLKQDAVEKGQESSVIYRQVVRLADLILNELDRINP